MLQLMIPLHQHVQTPPSEEEDPLDALDRVREILADGDHPFPVDRKTLKEVLRNKMGQEVERVKFLSSGQLSSPVPFAVALVLIGNCRHVSQGKDSRWYMDHLGY